MAMSHEQSEALPTSEAAVLGLIDVTARWQYRLLRVIGSAILRLFFRIEVRGRANIPAHGAYIVTANHLNWLDAPLLLMAFPVVPRMNFVADSTFVTKSDLRWFVVRHAGGVLPLIAHGHGAARVSRVVRECLGRGGIVGFFPEGSYGEKETMLLPFHRGFAKAAIDTRVCVVPVAISGTKELWLRKRVLVVIGEPIGPEGHTLDTLTAAARARIRAMLPAEARPSGPRLLRRWLSRLFP
jgi:1-acyl-sn-glycerol-3-phosphate acyltransferase